MATDNHAAPAWPPKQEPQDARPADTPKPRALRGRHQVELDRPASGGAIEARY